jgi:hypothetical protein
VQNTLCKGSAQFGWPVPERGERHSRSNYGWRLLVQRWRSKCIVTATEEDVSGHVVGRTKESLARRSVSHRYFFDVVDYQKFNRSLSRLQFEPKLFFNRQRKGRCQRACAGARALSVQEILGGLVMEYTAAYQTRSLSFCNTACSLFEAAWQLVRTRKGE